VSIGQITKIVAVSDGPKPQIGPIHTVPLEIEVQTSGGPDFLEISEDAAIALVGALRRRLQARNKGPFGEILELGHHEFIQRAQDLSIGLLDGTGPLLRLHASAEAHQSKPPGPGRHQGATTLAIRMDQAAAMMLFQQIRDLARTKDWPIAPEGEFQAGTYSSEG
jgi:hypothetical protein